MPGRPAAKACVEEREVRRIHAPVSVEIGDRSRPPGADLRGEKLPVHGVRRATLIDISIARVSKAVVVAVHLARVCDGQAVVKIVRDAVAVPVCGHRERGHGDQQEREEGERAHG